MKASFPLPTALHGLLAQDPAHRTPMTWEVDFPVPPEKNSTYENKRDKFGHHRYTLEMFGLRAEAEAPRFRAYAESFDLTREQP